MDATDIQDLFRSVLAIRCRRMFGGHGIYDGERIFALEVDGEIFLKTDEMTVETFRSSGSRPFTYRQGAKTATMSYWLLPEEARDDEESLREWVRLALLAAERSALAKLAVRPLRAARP